METRKFSEDEQLMLERLAFLHNKLKAGNGGLSHDEYDEYESLRESTSDMLPMSF